MDVFESLLVSKPPIWIA